MSILNVKVVVGAVNVGRNDAGKVAIVFLGVGTVHRIDQPFGVGVSFVTGMWWSIVQHGLVDGIGCLVGEDTGTEKGDQFLDLVNAAALHNVVIDENILAKEFDLLAHVGKQTSDLGSQVDHVSGLLRFENGFGGFSIAQITVLGREEDPLLPVLGTRLFNVIPNGSSDQTRSSRHHDDHFFVVFAHDLTKK